MELFKLLGTIAINNAEANSSLSETSTKAKETADTVKKSNDSVGDSNKSTGSTWSILKSKVSEYKAQGMSTSQAWVTAIKSMRSNTETSSSKMVNAFKKIFTAIGAYLVVDKVISFGKGCIQAAADAQAMNSQFTQVFGELETSASASLSKIADNAGISENRMKGSFTKIAAFAKTTGMDTAGSLALSERAMIAVADSAAFYDRSLEDTTESLQSFLKGNYENDAALGLSCTETTRNTAANALYGKSFKNLSESQKQLTLLQMVENANKTSGALGQAARESDTWTNVLGNLKQAWTDFQAVLGAYVLPFAVEVIKKFANVINALADRIPPLKERFDAFIAKAKEIGGYVGQTLKPIFDDISFVFGKIKDALQPLIDRFYEYVNSGQAAEGITNSIKIAAETLITTYTIVKELVLGIAQGFQNVVQWGKEHENSVIAIGIALGTLTTAIIAYNVAQGIKNAGGIVELAQLAMLQIQIWGLTAAETAHTVATTIATAATSAFGAVLAFITSPITLVIVAIGALIAVGVLLYKNWDTITAFCSQMWQKVSEIWGNLKATISAKIEEIKAALAQKWAEIKAKVSETMYSIKSTIYTIWNGIKSVISSAINSVKSVVFSVWNAIRSVTSSIWNGIRNTISSVWNGIKSSVSGAISGVKSTISSGLNSARSIVSNVLSGIKERFSSIFDSAKSIVRNAINTIKGFFNFSWSLPKIKLPHFKKSGQFSLNPPSVPSFSVSWYKKAMNKPMILNSPTIFGYDAKSGNMLGGGEAGSEVVSGTNTLMSMFRTAVSEQNGGIANTLERILAAILALDEHMGGKLREALEGTGFEINRREFARLVKEVK